MLKTLFYRVNGHSAPSRKLTSGPTSGLNDVELEVWCGSDGVLPRIFMYTYVPGVGPCEGSAS